MNSLLTRNLLFFLFFSFISFNNQLFAQTISPDFIRKVKVSDLTNDEVVKIKAEMDKQNMSMATFENLAISNGMSATDFSTLKTRIEGLNSNVNGTNVEKGITISEKPIELDAKSDIKKTDIYGSEIFNSTTLSFEPNANMATPANYILGAGDELQIVIYGMQEFASSATVSKEGRITIPIVGQVFVNGLTFEAARTQIKKACAKIYSSLGSGQSSLSISLSKIRTIKITIIGAKKSGNYSVSSLSTVFNALHIAGGPDANGSYRNIELLRNNKVIRKIDIYKFLAYGDQSDNINLLENDVIRIPVYETRVKVEGKVKREGVFELLPSESFNDLLRYCSGFDESAYRANIKLVQNTDKELRIVDMSEADYKNYKPNSGDIFKVSELLNRFSNKVSIKGSVFRPDDYGFVEGMTIKDLIDKADGLTEDAYKNRAILIREKEDLSKEMTDVNLNSILNGGANIVLRKNDELVISSLFDFKSQHILNISGQIKNPGEYPFIENIKLYDLILLSGGFTDGASKMVEISSAIIKDEKSGSNTSMSEVKLIEIDTLLMDQSKNITLKPYDFVQIRKKPIFDKQRFVTISGAVEYPGVYVVADKKEKILDIINRSGGLKFDADNEGLRVVRKTAKIEGGQTIVKEVVIPVDYKQISRSPLSRKNFTLQVGDEILVAQKKETVKILGSVQLNSEIPFAKSRAKYYISRVGGLSENADKKKIYVIYSNGIASNTKSFLGIKNYPKMKPGCELIVPEKSKDGGEKMSISEIGILSSAMATLGTSVIAIIKLTDGK